MSTEFHWIAFALVLVVSAARITRVAVFDDFPPAKWLRFKYADKTHKSDWVDLAFCGYCMSPWVTAVLVLWADIAGVLDGETLWGTSGDLAQPLWWIVNGSLAAAYVAAILVARDGDTSEPEEYEVPDEPTEDGKN